MILAALIIVPLLAAVAVAAGAPARPTSLAAAAVNLLLALAAAVSFKAGDAGVAARRHPLHRAAVARAETGGRASTDWHWSWCC